jgi:hypothetical protein
MANTNNFEADDWGDLEQELFTPEEIAASELRVSLMGEIGKNTATHIDTVIKLLAPLGKTLAIVPLQRTAPIPA